VKAAVKAAGTEAEGPVLRKEEKSGRILNCEQVKKDV